MLAGDDPNTEYTQAFDKGACVVNHKDGTRWWVYYTKRGRVTCFADDESGSTKTFARKTLTEVEE